MIKKAICPVATSLGLLLLVLSFAWPSLYDKNSVWSGEQELERSDAIGEFHRASFGANNDAVEQAKARLKRSNDALKQARDRHQWTVTLLKWSGIFLVVVGAIALLVTRIGEN